jgi:hypothetical protein
MNLNLKILTIMLVIMLPVLTGCFFKRGANPVGDTSLAESQRAAQILESEKPKVLAAAYSRPVAQRKYSFSKCGHKVSHNFREGVRRAAASLRISLMGADTSDHIYITFEKMMVKSENGVKTNISVESRRVDLLSASDLSEVLADVALAPGRYNYMEFSIKKAEIVDGGKTYNMIVPSRKIRFTGLFEIRDGYTTNLKIKFLHRIVKFRFFGQRLYFMTPVVKISSELVLKPVDPIITEGDITGTVENLVSLQKLSGVTVQLEGMRNSSVTDASGMFCFSALPAGLYTLKVSHPDYLDYSFPVEVAAGQVVSAAVQLNPAVITSTEGNTGWFSTYFPLADANGEYGEVALETPVVIDFVSLAFVKAEIKFTAQYRTYGSARCRNYLATSQQISADKDMGGWWVGNTATPGHFLGDFFATIEPGTVYTVDVTDMIRSNPSSSYFMASQNMDGVDIKMTNIQLSIYYR